MHGNGLLLGTGLQSDKEGCGLPLQPVGTPKKNSAQDSVGCPGGD